MRRFITGRTCQGGGVLGVVSLTKFENVCKSFKSKICKSYYVHAFVSLDDSKVCIWQELKCPYEHRNYVFPFQSSKDVKYVWAWLFGRSTIAGEFIVYWKFHGVLEIPVCFFDIPV